MKNGLHIDERGAKRYYLNNKLHREDGPAVIGCGDHASWYLHGERHCVDGPASKWPDGSTFWWLNGKKHREDGPAAEYANGRKFWYIHGKRHRVDGPAIIYERGSRHWHRWYIQDNRIIYPNDFKTMEEFIEKLNINEEYSLQWINDINGLIELIKNPTGKQTRLHAMRWKI